MAECFYDILLYKTGEIHSNGQDVYRRVGDKPRSGKYLLGTYFIGDAEEMSVCGKGYEDDYGVWDGEPISDVGRFRIVRDPNAEPSAEPMPSIWLVSQHATFTSPKLNWIEVREDSPPKDDDFTYTVRQREGGEIQEKRFWDTRHLRHTDFYLASPSVEGPFIAGLVRTDLFQIMRYYSWDTREKLDAALEGGGAVANGWNKRVLLEVKDLREAV